MDLKLGCAFTRFQTKYFQGKYGDLDTNLVSYRPCQTPTLWFCVRRSDEINAFQPESYYTIDIQLSKGGKDLALQWDRGQVFDMPVASLFMNVVQEDQAKAVVTDVTQKEDRMARPQALNTVAMLKMASTRSSSKLWHCPQRKCWSWIGALSFQSLSLHAVIHQEIIMNHQRNWMWSVNQGSEQTSSFVQVGTWASASYAYGRALVPGWLPHVPAYWNQHVSQELRSAGWTCSHL